MSKEAGMSDGLQTQAGLSERAAEAAQKGGPDVKELRPRGMTQDAFAELLKGAGFEACSKAAVSLAERPKDSGVQFTPEARKVAQELLKSTEGGTGDPSPTGERRTENRMNGRKTTVWLDDKMRSWCETQAYLRDVPVGELIRGLIREAMNKKTPAAGEAAEVREQQDERTESPATVL